MKKHKPKFIIIDWASNVCFHGKTFKTFEDAWSFIYEKFPDGDEDGTFDEYFVEEEGSCSVVERI